MENGGGVVGIEIGAPSAWIGIGIEVEIGN